MAVAPDSIHRVESIEEVDALPAFEQPVTLLAQTTLSPRDWSAVADHTAARFPELSMPGRSDPRFATPHSHSALGALAARSDDVAAIGPAHSSNPSPPGLLAAKQGDGQGFRD